jgi:hypothetical protein
MKYEGSEWRGATRPVAMATGPTKQSKNVVMKGLVCNLDKLSWCYSVSAAQRRHAPFKKAITVSFQVPRCHLSLPYDLPYVVVTFAVETVLLNKLRIEGGCGVLPTS